MTLRRILSLLVFLGALSCSENLEHNASDPANGGKPQGGTMQVVISATQNQTRTALETDGRTVRWAVGDSIAVWATTGDQYTLEAEPFTLFTYNSLYSSADFSALITPMSEAEYTYYAVYPQPATATGTTVSYQIPNAQSGAYNGALDILTATPITGAALDGNPREELALTFRHLLHMVRIEVPAGRNQMGSPLKQLEVTFPTEVTGAMSFEVTDPEHTLQFSSGSRTLTIDIPEGQSDNGTVYVYAFIRPCDIDGQISFRGYDEQGYCSYTIASQTISKQLTAGHTTPISVTIPERRIVRLDLSQTANNLGEELTNITLNLHQGYTFTDGQSSKAITPAADGHFYADLYFNPAILGAQIGIDYESESALLSGYQLTLPSEIAEHEDAALPFTVPYLFEENFSTINGEGHDDTKGTGNGSGYSLTDLNLRQGWSGQRVGSQAGNAIRINSRHEKAWFTGSYHGRLTSPPLSNLKAGSTVNIYVEFRSGGGTDGKSNSVLQFGTTTATNNPIYGDNDMSNVGSAINLPNGSNYNNIPTTPYTFTSSAASNTRLSWKASNASNKNEFQTYFSYIDDIKVKIVK